MKTIHALRVGICALYLVGSSALAAMTVEIGPTNAAAARTADARQAPGWSLRSATGQTVDFPQDADGQPTVLLFWPSWCPYSRALQPYVQSIWEDYRDAGVNVWTINIKERGDPVQTMEERGLSFPLLLEGDGLMSAYGIVRTPWLVVIDGANRIVYTRPARPPSPVHVAKQVRATLNELLGDNAVALPTEYPKPYDLHLRSRETRSTPLTGDPAPGEDWNGWARRYLDAFKAGPPPADIPPIRFGEDAPGLLEQSRQRWRARFGAETVEQYRQFRAYRQGRRWVTASVESAGPQGQGLVLVFDADSGQVLHIAHADR
jgi:peroxiredoxin